MLLLVVVPWLVLSGLKVETLHYLTQPATVATEKSYKTHSLASPETSSYAYLVVLAVVILLEKVLQV